MSRFSNTGGRGFHLSFDNNWTVSVQFSGGHYCDNYDKKWNFAEKFKDQRLRFFAAKHIFRNYPQELPKKVFLHLHKKISERFISLDKQSLHQDF